MSPISYVDAAVALQHQTRRETLEEVETLIEGIVKERYWQFRQESSDLQSFGMRQILTEIKKLPREPSA